MREAAAVALAGMSSGRRNCRLLSSCLRTSLLPPCSLCFPSLPSLPHCAVCISVDWWTTRTRGIKINHRLVSSIFYMRRLYSQIWPPCCVYTQQQEPEKEESIGDSSARLPLSSTRARVLCCVFLESCLFLCSFVVAGYSPHHLP